MRANFEISKETLYSKLNTSTKYKSQKQPPNVSVNCMRMIQVMNKCHMLLPNASRYVVMRFKCNMQVGNISIKKYYKIRVKIKVRNSLKI